jgi:hypothetical protein
MFVGTAMVSGGLYALLGMVPTAVAYWRKVRIEEHYLHQAFGEEYADYSRIGALKKDVVVRIACHLDMARGSDEMAVVLEELKRLKPQPFPKRQFGAQG